MITIEGKLEDRWGYDADPILSCGVHVMDPVIAMSFGSRDEVDLGSDCCFV